MFWNDGFRSLSPLLPFHCSVESSLPPSKTQLPHFPSVRQLKVKGGAHSSVRPSTSNRLITSLKRCVYHVNRSPKGPRRTKHPFVREGLQTDKRVGGISGWERRKQIAATAQCQGWEKSQFPLTANCSAPQCHPRLREMLQTGHGFLTTVKYKSAESNWGT